MKVDVLANQIKNVEENLKEHNRSQEIAEKKNEDAHLRIEEKLDALPAKLSEQFSSKWVEKFIYGLIAGGSLYFLYQIIELLR